MPHLHGTLHKYQLTSETRQQTIPSNIFAEQVYNSNFTALNAALSHLIKFSNSALSDLLLIRKLIVYISCYQLVPYLKIFFAKRHSYKNVSFIIAA